MDPAAGVVIDGTASDTGCNGCLPKGSEVRVNMGDPENPGMVLAATTSNQGITHSLSSESLQVHLANQRKAVCVDEYCRFIFPIGKANFCFKISPLDGTSL